jgi:glycosyltransferase involved in cell wall biosynthesis
MAAAYGSRHVTVAPFVTMAQSKPVPNSLLESLACGRPVIATREVGVAELIENENVGVSCEPTVGSLASALDEVRDRWSALAERTRPVAERWFALDRFVADYRQLYERIMR